MPDDTECAIWVMGHVPILRSSNKPRHYRDFFQLRYSPVRLRLSFVGLVAVVVQSRGGEEVIDGGQRLLISSPKHSAAEFQHNHNSLSNHHHNLASFRECFGH